MNNSGTSDSASIAATASQQCLVKVELNEQQSTNVQSLQSGGLSRHQHQTNLQLKEVHKRTQSMNSLTAVGDLLVQSRQLQVSNEHFPTLHESRRSTVPIVSSNPLLQIMEQRMAAHSASRYAPPLHEQSCLEPKTQCNPLLRMMEERMAKAHATVDAINTIKNERSVRNYNIPCSAPSISLHQASRNQHHMIFSQTSGITQTSNSQHVEQSPTVCPRLSRFNRSLSELERLRQENQLIQHRQQQLQEKSRRTSYNSMTESHTLLCGPLRRSTSSTSTTSLGKRSSDDDCSKGSAVSSLSSSSRKIQRSISMEKRSSAGSDVFGSSEFLDRRIKELSLNAESSIPHQGSSPANITKIGPPKKSLISILAQQSVTDYAAQAADITLQNNCIKQLSQVKMTSIISEIPDRIKYQNNSSETKPIDIVRKALLSRGLDCNTKPSKDMEDGYFVNITEMYGNEVVKAVRTNNVGSLRKLHADGFILQCGNQFGETLIHLACRRSHREIVSFLVEEAGVSLRVRDDYGRTPMHDLCWRVNPDLELFDILLEGAPELLMLSDDRGHTPLDYSRREHWDELIPFLLERTNKFQPVR